MSELLIEAAGVEGSCAVPSVRRDFLGVLMVKKLSRVRFLKLMAAIVRGSDSVVAAKSEWVSDFKNVTGQTSRPDVIDASCPQSPCAEGLFAGRKD